MSAPVLTTADALASTTRTLAIVTAVLALATVGLAVITLCGIRSARADARKQLAASYRPVLAPLQRSGETVTFRGGQILISTGPLITENPPDRKDLPTYSGAYLPIENVGTGPALNVRGTYTGPHGEGRTRFPTEAIAAGARGVVAFENWDGPSLGYTGNDQTVSAVIDYDDVAGGTYRSHIAFDIGNNAYTSTLDTRAPHSLQM